MRQPGLTGKQPFVLRAENDRREPILPIFCIAANVWIERSETNEAYYPSLFSESQSDFVLSLGVQMRNRKGDTQNGQFRIL